jgi:hypothetical protein
MLKILRDEIDGVSSVLRRATKQQRRHGVIGNTIKKRLYGKICGSKMPTKGFLRHGRAKRISYQVCFPLPQWIG